MADDLRRCHDIRATAGVARGHDPMSLGNVQPSRSDAEVGRAGDLLLIRGFT
jgi:hypothetical protein